MNVVIQRNWRIEIMREKIVRAIEKRKEMIKSGEICSYVEYDKGYIHAMSEVLDMIDEPKNKED